MSLNSGGFQRSRLSNENLFIYAKHHQFRNPSIEADYKSVSPNRENLFPSRFMDNKLRISVCQLNKMKASNGHLLPKIEPMHSTTDNFTRKPLNPMYASTDFLNIKRKPLDRNLLKEAASRDTQQFIRQTGECWHTMDRRLGGMSLKQNFSIKKMKH